MTRSAFTISRKNEQNKMQELNLLASVDNEAHDIVSQFDWLRSELILLRQRLLDEREVRFLALFIESILVLFYNFRMNLFCR